jgi:hypothetical protein
MDRTHSLARFISIAGHPFVLLPLAVGYVVSQRLSFEDALHTMGVLLGWFVLFGTYVVIQVKRGVWTDVDVSKQEHRPHMYLLAVPLGVASVLVMWWRGYPAPVLIGMGSAAAMMAAGAIINRWIKVSLHSAFAVYAVMIPVPVLGPPGLMLLAIPLAVAWARVAMGRHTRAEVLLGLVFGALAAVPLLL